MMRSRCVILLIALAIIITGMAYMTVVDSTHGQSTTSSPEQMSQVPHLLDSAKAAYQKGDLDESIRILSIALSLIQKQKNTSEAQEDDLNLASPRVKSVTLSDGETKLTVYAGAEKYYRLPTSSRFPDLFQPEEGIGLSATKPIIKGTYLKVGGKTVEITFSSSDPNVIAIEKDVLSGREQGLLEFRKAGHATITVSIEHNKIEFPFDVIDLPFRSGDNVEVIIAKWGLPDKEVERYLDWLDSAFIDGIFYYANTDDGSGMKITHWHYDKYSFLFLKLGRSGTMASVINKSWIKPNELYKKNML